MPDMSIILNALEPNSLGDIFIYSIFFLSLFSLFLLPDGNERSMYLLFGTMFLAVIDLFYGALQDQLPFDDQLTIDFIHFLVQLLMFILPALAAGLIRIRKKKGGTARILGFVTVLIAVIYVVMNFMQPGVVNASFQ